MFKRQIGKSDLQTSPVALGGNVFGWTADESTSFRILDSFVEAGFNLIDTADVYTRWVPGHQGGESETVIGKWLKKSGKRKQVLIATKVGFSLNSANLGNPCLQRNYIIKAAEDSLRRLQIDCIDLYQTHIDDSTTPVAETMEALNTLVQQGKVRAIGASQISPARIRDSQLIAKTNNWAQYCCLQPGYNLCARDEYENNDEPLAQELNLGVITYFSLAAGFLTGKYRTEADLSKSPRGARTVKSLYFNDKGMKILSALDKVSESTQSSLATVALAWLLSKPSVTAPIASATSLEQLQDILKSPYLRLKTDELQILNDASSSSTSAVG